MKEILESVAARAANGWQRAGSKFDFEVFAMPLEEQAVGASRKLIASKVDGENSR